MIWQAVHAGFCFSGEREAQVHKIDSEPWKQMRLMKNR